MTYRPMHNDPQSERLLLVQLEGSENKVWLSPYRHLSAQVVRRAVPHVRGPQWTEGNKVYKEYNDAHPEICSGYRVASWTRTRLSGLYVDSMRLRGQLDTGSDVMNEGRPYGNKVEFTPHTVDKNIARAILNTYSKYDMFHDKHGISRATDNFYAALNHLAQFLKITKVLFLRDAYANCHAGLGNSSAYEEVDIAFAEERILHILAPFHRPKPQA